MGIYRNIGGRVLALASVTALTVVLAFSLSIQGTLAPASSREDEAARLACEERLVRAAETAWADGDAELAHWIESLPSYPEHHCSAPPTTQPR